VARRIAIVIGVVVAAFVVAQAYLVWWPSLLQGLPMHGMR
jgi:hypothetical protein